MITPRIIDLCINEVVGMEKLAVILTIENLLLIASEEHCIYMKAYGDAQDCLIHCREVLSALQESYGKNQHLRKSS